MTTKEITDPSKATPELVGRNGLALAVFCRILKACS